MYGLVNQAVQELAVQIGGASLWTSICERAGIGAQVFVGMDSYPDDVTFRLVDAASVELKLSPAAVLEAFGRHWILYTGRAGYGPVFETMGRTLPEFLGNLDAMHARLSLSMPELRPPSFGCEILGEDRLILAYWSERVGLEPMVVGLLTGLGEYFGVPVEVTHTLARTDGADHDEFLVVHGQVAAEAELGPAEQIVAQ